MNAILLQLATYTLDWCKRNADATLILAIATETPRWTVVFTALHEPAWIGVTMGVLISWAAKRGWHAWKDERTRWGLFVLNAWVLASAVAIIAPVLFEMTKHPIELVNVSDALLGLHPYALWVWVLLVAQSTFMPLIQAVVAQPHTASENVVANVDTYVANVHESVGNVGAREVEPEPTTSEDDAINSDDVDEVDAEIAPKLQLDARQQQVYDAIMKGAATVYAISKETGIAQTTLRRGDKGVLPAMVQLGALRNGDGTYKPATQGASGD